MTTPRDPIYAGHRYPAEIISYAVWLYFRFPLSLRMVEEMLAARGISVTHETIRQWGLKFGREFANRIRRRAPRRGDKCRQARVPQAPQEAGSSPSCAHHRQAEELRRGQAGDHARGRASAA